MCRFLPEYYSVLFISNIDFTKDFIFNPELIYSPLATN